MDPVPHNPYEGRELTDELTQEIMAGCRASWEVDDAWMIGDMAHVFLRLNEDKTLQDFIDMHPPDHPSDEYPTANQLQTIIEVCIAFPGPVRDLSKRFFDHYAGWVKANQPDRASRGLDQMRASGEYE